MFTIIEVISSISSGHNCMKPFTVINKRKRNEKKNYMKNKPHATKNPTGQQ